MDGIHTRFVLMSTVAWELQLQHRENVISAHQKFWDTRKFSWMGLGHVDVVWAQQGSFRFIHIHWLLFFSHFRDRANCLPQSLSMYTKIFQQPDGGRSHKTSASHFNRIDFGIPSSLLSFCCQFGVAKFVALIGLFNWLPYFLCFTLKGFCAHTRIHSI